jgi:hypothetical protein
MPATTISITGRSVLRLLALVLGHPRPAARLSGALLGIVVLYRSRVAPEAAGVAIWTGVSPGYDACEVSTHHGRAGRLVDAKALSSEDFPWMRFRLRSPIFTANGFLLAQVSAALCGLVTP